MPRLIYIAAPSFSGSTLLTLLLNSHPEITTLGELKWGSIDLDHYRCSCGSLLRQCKFWEAIRTRVERQGFQFDLRHPPTDFRFPDHPFADRIARARNRGPIFEGLRQTALVATPICRERWPSIAALNLAVIEAALELRNATAFVDGSKDPTRLTHLIATGHYDVFMIHLIRDGRGVVRSAVKNKGQAAEGAARDWVRTHRQIERIASDLGPSRALTLHYESLCKSLQAQMARIQEFLRLKAPFDLDHLTECEHHILGNAMRLTFDGRVALDESWRQLSQERDLQQFNRCAAAMSRRYGYE